MPSDRSVLRQNFRARRDALSPEGRASKSILICQHLVAHARALKARRVALFAAVGSEVRLDHALQALTGAGTACVLPRVVQPERPLEFAAATGPLRLGSWGVAEPLGPTVPLAGIDLVVVPGLVFDAQGYRLGYGQGYYDRTLAGYAGRTVGVAFALQVTETLPRAPHDVPVQAVITEAGLA